MRKKSDTEQRELFIQYISRLDWALTNLGFKKASDHYAQGVSYRNYENLEEGFGIHLQIGDISDIFDTD